MKASRFFRFGGPGQRGQSTVEVLIAAAVLAVAVQAAVLVIRTASRQNVSNRDRAFATEKAMQMLEEIRNLVQDGVLDVKALDDYSDGYDTSNAQRRPNYKYTLTTKDDVIHPLDGSSPSDASTGVNPLSGNPIRSKGYAFVRHINIYQGGKDVNMRKVYVRIYYAAPNAGTASLTLAQALDPSAIPLAEVFGMVRSQGTANQPDQVLDVHLVALENVPGWWSRTSNLIPLMKASLTSLQARNPGLKIREHWITRLSFGRDLEYTPEINETVRADATGAFKKAYVYPGLIKYDDSDDYYYLVDHFRARMNIQGVLNTSDPARDTLGYPLADQFNHAMRYPDEVRLYEIIKSIARNKGLPEPEMSLRMLLEKMKSDDPALRNAIVINLHGEMVPVPPLRNVSDAAKDPLNYYNRGVGMTNRAWRVVSHPERLRYDTTVAGQEDQAFRVYAYDMDPPAPTGAITAADEDDLIDQVTLFIPNGTFLNLAQVERIQGNSRVPYHRFTSTSSNWVVSADGMYVRDGVTDATSSWIADEYTPPGRLPGLRIRLYGVTPTARAYFGPAWSN